MAFSKVAKPTTSFSSVAKPKSAKSGLFGFGRFGSARFSAKEGYTKNAKPASSFTKIAKT